MKRLSSSHTEQGKLKRLGWFVVMAGICCLHAVAPLSAQTITYVQGAYVTPQNPQTTVNVVFAGAQTAGNLNVVVVGWNDTTAAVSSVRDTKGNLYTRAVGPTTISGALSQSIYYAKNIVSAGAGANTVTVTFSVAASYPDIRILEYSGADPNTPVDVTAAGSGNGASSNSSSATTTNPTDLIFGANTVATLTSGPGSGFTQRLLTVPDGDISEDRSVTAIGSYSATAPIQPSGQWVMQMVAFRTGPNFNLTASPGSLTIAQGNQGTSTITSTISGGFNSGISLSASGVPSGATASFNPNTIPAPGAGTSTMTITVGVSTPVGTYPITVTGNGGGIQHTTTVTLTVASGPTFTISAAPTSLTILQGNQGTSTITTTAVAGFNSSIALSATGAPSGTSVGFNPSTIPAPGSGTSTMTIIVGGTTTPGTYPITVTGSGGGVQQNTTVTLTVTQSTITPPANLMVTNGGPSPTVVSTQSYLNATFLSTHVTSPFNSTGGDLILLVASSHFGVTFSPSDNFGNSWISIAGPTTTALGFDLRTQIWYAPHPVVGSGQTITMGLSQAMPLVMSILVLKGTNMSSPIDAPSTIGSDNGTQTLNVVTPNITTSAANDLLLAWTKVSAGATFTSGNGFTPQPGASSNFLDAETGLASTAGIYNATFLIDSPQSWQSAAVAAANNPSQTLLTWNASTEQGGTIAGYSVERCQNAGCSNFVPIGTTTNTTYNDTGVVPSTNYSYRVRAQDTNGNYGPYSSVVSITIPPSIPSLPGNLTATSPANTEIDLSWIAATEVNGTINQYLVERCQTANCSNFVQVGTSVTATYADLGLTTGTTYTYRVRAQDTVGTVGPYSNVAIATAQTPDNQAPSNPSSLMANAVGSSQINLSWIASTDNIGVSGYFIERCQGAGCTSFFRVAVGTGTTYNDTGLSANTTYNYRVRATDAQGNLSGYSNVATGTTSNGAPTFTLSASPSSLTVAPGNQGTTTITSSISNGFNSSISLSASGVPSGTTVNFNPSTIPAPGSGTSVLTIIVGAGTPTGTYPITVTGNGGGIQKNTTVTLTVSTAVTITFVQGNYNAPQSPQTTVGVTYTGAQTAGDLNVVAVGWNDSTAIVNSVRDSKGNAYTLAVGPTVVSGTLSQSIYYAKNIVSAAAGTNTVTATFSTSAQYPDVRVLEYRGADPTNPVDVTAANTGNSTTSSSGSVSTLNPADLLLGANMVTTFTTAAGSGFTSRLLTSPDGDIAEDRTVTTTGSYSATATLSPAGPWIMQMVAFRASGGGGPVLTSIAVTPTNPSISVGSPLQFTATGTYSDGSHQDLTNSANWTSSVPSVATISSTGLATGVAPGNTTIQASVGSINGSTTLTVTAVFAVSPRAAVVTFTQTQQFNATPGFGNVTWLVDGVVGGSPSLGTITTNGLYTPPTAVGTHVITANTNQQQSANATVYVSNYAGMFTYHNDNLRTGQNTSETVLSPTNVTQTQFGKLFSYQLDGIAFASPLYVANVSIPGRGVHNVVYVATENDSVYAFDADGLSNTALWRTSFLGSNVTPIPPCDTGECTDIPVQIGITGTPVIDQASGTLYVVAATKENGNHYFRRLHALDITTGAEKFGGPVVISGSVPGTGDGSSGGRVPFDPLEENQRPALLLSNGVVYIGFASHGDNHPWHGWVIGYNASTLQQVMIYNVTPNAFGGGIWQGGGGLATDATGNIFFTTGNGTFDANTGGVDYGDSVEKISPSGNVVDYFTPHDQQNMDVNDLDLGSGGPVLLVDQPGSQFPHELISAGKSGTIYVVNRDNMGHYSPNNDNQIIQSLPGILPHGDGQIGNFSTPVYFNGYVYFGAVNDTLKVFQLSNGRLSASPTSQSAAIYPIRGASFAVSANGSSNGILWALQNNGQSPDNDTGAPGVLYAYDATNLGNELYDSSQAGGRDTLDLAAKFSIPLIANGKVFIAGQSQLTVFGLLP